MVILDYHSPRPRLPGALVAVAWLFIGFGILAAIEVALAALNGRLSINLGVLGIFIGRGLLRRSPGWYGCAKAVLWLMMLLVALVAVLAIMWNSEQVRLSGVPVFGGASALIAAAFVIAVLALCFWQYRVLVRPDVAQLFKPRIDSRVAQDVASRLEQIEDDTGQ